MALIIETGAGNVANAESYATAADLIAFSKRRGNIVIPDMDAADLEPALVNAADYMRQYYRLLWKGYRQLAEQPMDWPRMGVPMPDAASWFMVPMNTIPREVKEAQMMLAQRVVAGGDLMADLERKTISEAVGSLQVVYDNRAPEGKRYPAVDALLAPYIAVFNGMMETCR